MMLGAVGKCSYNESDLFKLFLFRFLGLIRVTAELP